ncbi:MAG: antibiotic biosynthesis monooxygenase [Rhizobiaceae bacterium]
MKIQILAALAALLLVTGSASSSVADKAPVTLINAFIVPADREAEAILFWERAAAFMKRQPGYVSTALHRAILPDAKFKLINIAKWESVDAFKRASMALRTTGGIKPVDGVVSAPSLYEVIRAD